MDDIVFCERLPEAEKKKSGLFLPGTSFVDMFGDSFFLYNHPFSFCDCREKQSIDARRTNCINGRRTNRRKRLPEAKSGVQFDPTCELI